MDESQKQYDEEKLLGGESNFTENTTGDAAPFE
ncbi:MAG: hypothetical protein DGJ47_000830 [Rickettsiaceae bacterium]